IDIAQATNWPAQAGAALMVVSLAQRASGDLEDALRAVRESVRMLEPPKGEKSTGRLLTYALALTREGQILAEDRAIRLNRRGEGWERMQRAMKIAEDSAGRYSNDFQSQYRVCLIETKLAGILRYADPGRALQLYDDGLRRLATVRANAGTPLN